MSQLVAVFLFGFILLLADAQEPITCKLKSDCHDQLTCFNHQCVDPCKLSCGSNTVCTVNNHKADCKCKQGYSGDAEAGCLPSCGILTKLPPINPDVRPLINRGTPTELGEFPWLAAIFLKERSGRWAQQCAGTLISPHLVVTAAHCLKSNTGNIVKPEDIQVGLGKYFRDYYKEEKYSVTVKVRDLIFPNNYNGDASSYALDIGLLDLSANIQPSVYVMPACLDLKASVSVSSGDEGYIAGWGTTENGTLSETVLSARLSYMSHSNCIGKLKLNYKRFLTHDKFCAGGEDGQQPDKGDSGGGLTFLKDGLYHVIGVVSTKVVGESSFALFTDLQNDEHQAWLQRQISNFENVVVTREEIIYEMERRKLDSHRHRRDAYLKNILQKEFSLVHAVERRAVSFQLTENNPYGGCVPHHGVSAAGCWPPKTLGKRKRYHFNKGERLNWFDAFQSCRKTGKRLASANSAAEVQMLLTVFKENSDTAVYGTGAWGLWMAGTDVMCEDEWRWMSTGQRVDMSILRFTDDGWPNNSDDVEHCLEVYQAANGKSLLWNDDSCGRKKYFVCEEYE